MEYKMIATENAPKAIGPYSQGVSANGFVFVSGQLPIDPKTGIIAEADFAKQTNQSMKNVIAVLEAEGSCASNIVQTTIFVSDLSGFGTVNTEYAKYFSEHLPARACVEVSRLPKDVLVEIAAIAIK